MNLFAKFSKTESLKVTVFLKIYFFLLCFLIFGLLFKPGMLFYEGKLYVYYLASMLSDFDFNLINQVPESMRWLVTKTLFHPDQHPETQTALMLPYYALEFLAKKMSFSVIPATAFDFLYSLSTLAMNLFSLLLGFYFVNKICSLYSIKFEIFDYVFFTFGTTVFYFSFLQTSVLEIAAFPLQSYLLYIFFEIKNRSCKFSPLTALTVGIACSFLFVSKLTFLPACLGFGSLFCLYLFQQRRFRSIFLFVVAFGLVLTSFAMNQLLKYGHFREALPPLRHFYDFSFENFARNLYLGFFPAGGVFFANPIFFFSLLGFIIFFFKKLFLQKPKLIVSFIFSGWFFLTFFGHVFLAGYIVEDHLPGRIHLAFLPPLLLGFIYLRSLVHNRFRMLSISFFSFFVIWHLVLVFCYLVLIQGSSLDYAGNLLPGWEKFLFLFPKYLSRVSDNASGIAAHLEQILIFTFLLSVICFLLKNYRRRGQVVSFLTVACAITYLSMSVLNLTFQSQNIETMRSRGIYDKVAIGDGAEIFYIDYVMQYVSTAMVRCTPPICEHLKNGVERYYSEVKKQTIRSVPQLDRAIQMASPDFSIWIEMEKNKVRTLN